MKWLHVIAYLFLFVGGINWGLVGLFQFNLVMYLFGAWPMVESFVYILVGLSAVYLLLMHKSYCMICSKMMKKK